MNINDIIIEYEQNAARAASLLSYSNNLKLLEKFKKTVIEYKNPEPEILNALIKIYENRQWEDAYSWLIVAQLHPSEKYSEVICNILNLKDENAPNEAIVELLIDLKEQRCVYSLKNLISADFITQDEQLILKILEALSEIGGDEAISVLKNFSKSLSRTIREEADLLLDDMEQ